MRATVAAIGACILGLGGAATGSEANVPRTSSPDVLVELTARGGLTLHGLRLIHQKNTA